MTEVKKGKRKIGSTTANILLVLVIVIAINVIAAGFYFRLDITEENLYTLSKGTANIVKNIKTPITIKYYFTRGLSSLPMRYKTYGNKIKELLDEYQNLNPKMVQVEDYDPKPDSDEEEWAKKYGLSGIELGSGETLYMGLVVIQEDKELNLPILDPRREQFLEYDITQLLLQIYQKKNKTLGIMSTLPVMGSATDMFQQMQGQKGQPKWAFVSELEKTFKIKSIEFNTKDIPDGISILMVIHPKQATDVTLYAIDQFVMRGGELVVLVDPSARSDQTASMMARMGQGGQAISDLYKLFKQWGIDYNAALIVADLDHPTRVNAGDIGVVPYSLWHSLNKSSFNPDLIATKGLENMLMIEPGGFSLTEKSPLKLNPLIQTSTNSGTVISYLTQFQNPLMIEKNLKVDGKRYTMAGILTGPLTSAFEQRPADKEEKDKNKEAKEQKKEEKPVALKPHVTKTSGNAKILLITDVDFVSDAFSVDRFNLMGQTLLQPKNDNLNFMVNMVEFLGGAEEMMEIRSRGKFTRPFTHFDELQEQAQKTYQVAENNLSAKLQDVQQKLSQLKVDKGTNQVVLTTEQMEKIKQFREEEKKTKTELRKIRKLLRQDIETEQSILTGLNLLVIPLLLAVFGLLLFYRRFRLK